MNYYPEIMSPSEAGDPTTASSDQLTEGEVLSKWQELSPLLDTMMARVGNPGSFRTPAGTSLMGDDQASSPYQVSHAIQACLSAGVDHLHAAKRLVVDHGDLHVAAPASLARGAIENLATAYWILRPASRNTRIERVLRWHAKNAKDRETALSPLPAGVGGASADTTLAKLAVVANARDILVKDAQKNYTSTEVVKYCEEHLNVDNSQLGIVFPWRLCSGFAHGRQWAYLGASNVQQEEEVAGVVPVRLTSDLGRALYPVLAATHLLQDLLRLHGQRTAPV